MKDKPDYANWIPNKLLLLLGTASASAVLLFVLSLLLGDGYAISIVRVVLVIFSLLSLTFFGYMCCARRLLAYDGGNVQGKILDNVLAHLDWNGEGKLLDIGCGSGALTIKSARKFPRARIVGVDCWEGVWDYAKSQCEENARIEGVADRVAFQKGDAARLDFPDETFDAIVSNFVFHEVRTQPDKLALIREALRVLKPGGVFSLGDIYYSKSVYRNLEAMLRDLSKHVSSLTFVDTRKNDFVPSFLKTPLIAGNMGLIRGRK